jgi:hypothetical protein
VIFFFLTENILLVKIMFMYKMNKDGKRILIERITVRFPQLRLRGG